ncbi:MAG: helix-turn-helix domain-containing protein [Anaerolineae bacterium]|nr:helix-turn-helix domain-containing protein [Anaerolineae bacterium]
MEDEEMSTRTEDLWTPEQEALLRQEYGRIPRRQLAEKLGRSEVAIKMRARVLRVPSPRTWQHIMLSTVLTYALGFGCEKSVRNLMCKGVFPVHYVYLGNTRVPAVNIKRMQQWLGDPNNWYCLDVDRIVDPRYQSVVRLARRQWNDEWLTVGQIAELMGYSQQGINKLIHGGALPAKRHNNWHVLKSDALKVKRIVQQGGGCWSYT